jgi:RNA polymerase sigma-70 factor (ECF subfamily)
MNPTGPTGGVAASAALAVGVADAAAAGPCAPGLSSDPALLRRALRGEAEAREDLARWGGDAAFRFAFQLLGDRDAARDVAQDSLLRLFGALGRVDPERPLAPWLLRIVRNRVIDLRRRDQARHSSHPVADSGELELPDHAPDPLATSERRELQRLMWACLSRLDAAHREILVLRDYQDLSYRDIAEVLDIPLGTVMSRLHAARRKLRGALLETGYRFGGAS